MPLPPFDTMVNMSSKQLDELLEQEAEKLIQEAPPERQDRYRAMFNGCKLKSQAAEAKGLSKEARMVASQEAMWESFTELNNLLQEAVGK